VPTVATDTIRVLCGTPPWHLWPLAAARGRGEKEREKRKNRVKERDRPYPGWRIWGRMEGR